MPDVVVVEAVRTPFGKRNGALAGMHSVELLGLVQRTVLQRAGLDPTAVDQVVAGCVGQVGMQKGVQRGSRAGAWLTAGLPMQTPATTIDTQCGSSQQAVNLAHALISSGAANVVLACGVEVMSTVKMGSTVPRDGHLGKPVTRNYWKGYEYTSQFEGAERIDTNGWGITLGDADAFGKLSQDRAKAAQAAGAFATQLVDVDAPALGDDGEPTGETRTVTADEGVRGDNAGKAGHPQTHRPRERRAHRRDVVADLRWGIGGAVESAWVAAGSEPAGQGSRDGGGGYRPGTDAHRPHRCHTPIARGSPARHVRYRCRGDQRGVRFGCAGLGTRVVAGHGHRESQRRRHRDGVIPLGATGLGLVAKTVHELVRSGGEYGLVTMCCGGGLGTGTLVQRI